MGVGRGEKDPIAGGMGCPRWAEPQPSLKSKVPMSLAPPPTPISNLGYFEESPPPSSSLL